MTKLTELCCEALVVAVLSHIVEAVHHRSEEARIREGSVENFGYRRLDDRNALFDQLTGIAPEQDWAKRIKQPLICTQELAKTKLGLAGTATLLKAVHEKLFGKSKDKKWHSASTDAMAAAQIWLEFQKKEGAHLLSKSDITSEGSWTITSRATCGI